MTEKLNVKIGLGYQQGEYPLEYQFQDNYAKVSISDILKIINRFIGDKNVLVKNYLNIQIQVKEGKDKKRVNLFKIRKNNSTINLTHNQNGQFEIKILLEDIEDKHNYLKHFHCNSDHFTRLSNNINKIIEQSKEEQKKIGQSCMRPIDIAYFFADPLVKIEKKKITAKYEVSYQLQYDKFIELVKKEQFGKNFRIEMMVATKTNIINTLHEGASILHFACHGKKPSGNLQIQSESSTSVGQLVDLQHKHFMDLLDSITGNALPNLIIFNVCYSSKLAKQISSKKNIITIGYNDEAKDIYCQRLTRQIYLGLFKDRMPIRELFQRIKNQIIEQNPIEGNKLQIYPEVPYPGEEQIKFFSNPESRSNFVKKWTISESMRENELLGVKCQMFDFIQNFLTKDQRISYLFLKGQKRSGKSDFMKKTRIYIMNRKVFTEDYTIELKNPDGSYITTLLELRLEKQQSINTMMNTLKDLSKQRRTKPLIIFDLTERILKIQYGKFIQYIHSKIIKEIRYGKIVIITNNVTPIIKAQTQIFQKAHIHTKWKPDIKLQQFNLYMQRYVNEQLRRQASKIYTSREYQELKLIKAIKSSKSQKQLRERCQKQEKSQNTCKLINLQYIELNVKELQKAIQDLQSCANIKIEDNDYIFLSTIYMEMNLDRVQKYTEPTCNKKSVSKQIKELIENFDHFIHTIFKVSEDSDILLRVIIDKNIIKTLFHLSLKIGALIYVFRDFSNLLQKHLLNCQRLHALISGFYIEQLKKNSELLENIKTYHLKLLLTLFSFYSERQNIIKFKKNANKDQKIEESKFRKKTQIIKQEIMNEFDKKQHQMLFATLNSLFFVNNIAQELHYNHANYLFAQNEQRPRLHSGILQNSYEEEIQIEKKTGIIDQHHKTIDEYWKAFKQIQKYEQNRANIDAILRKESIILLEIIILKEVMFNLRELDIFFDKGESFINQNVNIYISFYIEIMQKIHEDKIFDEKPKNGLFCHHECESIKPLYQQYVKAYVETYFRLVKRKQSLTKQFSLAIFLELIRLCDKHITKQKMISVMKSTKKMIEIHINEQFFNTWTCPTYIALPLAYYQNGSKKKSNIKRYEYYVYNFLQNFYEKELDKEVKFQLKLFKEDTLIDSSQDPEQQQKQQSKRNLIQLVICDFNQSGDKAYLEDQCAQSVPFEIKNETIQMGIKDVQFWKAPIVIFFGTNVKNIDEVYNKMGIIVIWINVSDIIDEKNLNQKEKKILKDIDVIKTCCQDKTLGIYFSILEFFYCSFCRHFFNGNHSSFIDQFKNSFNLAKAETIIKTKILFSSDEQFSYKNQIQNVIQEIDCNLQYLLSHPFGQDLIRKPAYHFIYKQKKMEKMEGQQKGKQLVREKSKTEKQKIDESINEKIQGTPKNDKKKRNSSRLLGQKINEIGCNYEICQLLGILSNVNKNLDIIVNYKSQPMLIYFIRTLKIKLMKAQKLKLSNFISGMQYSEQRKKILDPKQIHELPRGYLGEAIIFVNLQQQQAIQELKSQYPAQYPVIRIFFTRYRYPNIKNINEKMSIEEDFKTNRLEYQYFCLQCDTSKPNVSLNKIFDRLYKEAKQKPSLSLQDLKNTIQRL